MEIKVLVVKDEDGNLRPQHKLWVISSPAYEKAARDEWEFNLSKKKEFKGCVLVEATLKEQETI
jgi:hypothetical protein